MLIHPDVAQREEDSEEVLQVPKWKDTPSREMPISKNLLSLKGNSEDWH